MADFYFTRMTSSEFEYLLDGAEKVNDEYYSNRGYVFKIDIPNEGVYVVNTPLEKWWEAQPEPLAETTEDIVEKPRTRRSTKF